MHQPVVLLARVLGFVDSRFLVAGRDVYFPELVRALADRFEFQKSPEKLEDFDLSKGVEFLEGRSGRRPIQKFVIWDSTLVVETTSSTKDSREILEEILLWGVEKFGINYAPNSIPRHAYVSDITFRSDAPLLALSPSLSFLAESCSAALSEIWQEPVTYQPISIRVGHDPTARQYGIAHLSVERRGGVRFSDNKYFSEAPLPTDMHLSVLEHFEKYALSSGK